VKSSLTSLFSPRSIAVIGATDEISRAGGRALAILKMAGFQGAIYPVHPTRTTIQGLPAYPSLSALPSRAELAIISLAPERVVDAITECGNNGVGAATVFADGFTQTMSEALGTALREARAKSGLRMLGPNTIGFRALAGNVYGTFAGDIELGTMVGPTAFIAQSGGMSTYFGSTCLAARGIGTRYLIDTGNEFDLAAADCIEHIAHDPEVNAIALMAEGAKDGRKLIGAVQLAVSKGKTVVALKMARSIAGLAQAASHTGALAGRGELFDSELRAAGACVVTSETELLNAMSIAGLKRIPAGRGVGIVTSSGGFGILALDAAERAGMAVPVPALAPSEVERQEIKGGKFANPFDFSSSLSAGPKAAETALNWIISQPNIDCVVAFHFYSAMRVDRQESLFRQLSTAAKATSKPIFVCGVAPADFAARLHEFGVIWFEDPSSLMNALSNLMPGAPAMPAVPHKPDATGALMSISGAAARHRLEHLGHLPQVPSHPVTNAGEARTIQQLLGGKVVLKVESDAHAHKSDFGLVAGPLAPHELEAAFAGLDAARRACGAQDAPIVLQPFEQGTELALGAYHDPIFGPSVMVAVGGIFLEILNDAAFAAAPIDMSRARRMILSLKGAPLLQGARGKPPADIDAAAAALCDLSDFISRNKDEIQEVDINPLIVKDKGKGVIAVDALLIPRVQDLQTQHVGKS